MVVSVRPQNRIAPRPQPMAVPKKPRSPFGDGSIWGGMPSYISNAVQGVPEMLANLGKPDAAPQQPAQPQFDPSKALGIYGEQYQKPKAGWSDALGYLGGTLMDLDGTMGQGNAAQAQAMMQQRMDEGRAEFDQRREEQIRMLAAQGDPTALAMMDPIGARNFQYQQGRDQKGDALTERAWLQDQQRYETEQEWLQRNFERGVFENDRSFNAGEAARRAANTPRNIWQPAGEGAIFNQSTGEIRNSQGGDLGAGFVPGMPGAGPSVTPIGFDTDNPFIRMQFGGNLVQGAPSFFDNGEIYQPGPGDTATPGGARPPNVTDSYNRYRSSGLAKSDGEQLKLARDEAVAVTTQLKPQIQEMRSFVGTFPMGITSDLQYQIGRVAGDAFGLGMSPQEQANRDAFNGQAKKLALSLGRDLKPFSNSDRDWIQSMVANPGQNKESAAQVLDTLEKMADYRLFYAQGAEAWQNQYGGLSMRDGKGQNFFESWGEWSSMNPVSSPQFSPDAPTKGTGEGTVLRRGETRGPQAGGRSAAPVTIKDDAGYDALPSGALFIGPDGVQRRKP